MKSGDYANFYDYWRDAFERHQIQVERAVGALPKIQEFTAASGWDKTAVQKLTSTRWFAERTFDQFLWLVGAPPRA